jgi:hypothetical protein
LVLVLAFRVNALRSQVHHAEVKIIALKQERMYLETEFETRANQQQLKAWNDVEFGYVAPNASQYLENERQLAVLSKPVEADAPAPIRVASMDDSVIAQAAFPVMVSPLSGKPLSGDKSDDDHVVKLDHADATAALGERLATVEHQQAGPADKPKVTRLVAKDGAKSADKKSAEKGKSKSDKPVDKKLAKASSATGATGNNGAKAKAADKSGKPVSTVKLAAAKTSSAVKKPVTAKKEVKASK